MKQRFYLYRRSGTFYLQDARTGKQQSLDTKDRQAALRLLEIKRQTDADPGFNQFILKTCLATRDPLLPKRTWQTVMDQIQTPGKESSRRRYIRAMKAKAFTQLRQLKLVETRAEDFLMILNDGKVSVVHFLKRLHNLALGLGWLALPVLAPRLHTRCRRGSAAGAVSSEPKLGCAGIRVIKVKIKSAAGGNVAHQSVTRGWIPLQINPRCQSQIGQDNV